MGGGGEHREELEPSWLFGVLAQGRGLLCLAKGKKLGPWARFHIKRSLSRQGHTGVTTPQEGEEIQAEPQRKKQAGLMRQRQNRAREK